METRHLVCIGVLMVLVSITKGQTTARLPPSIYSKNDQKIVFRQGDKKELRCEATGKPTPNYRWMKDGKEISFGGMYVKKATFGNIEIDTNLGIDAAGIYSCKAWNDFGSTLSTDTEMIKAVVQYFPADEKPVPMTAIEGQKFKIPCNKPLNNFPTPSYKWLRRTKDGASKVWDDANGRKTIDSDGNLHFTYVTGDDENQPTYLYYCGLIHPLYNVDIFGSPVELSVTKVPNAPNVRAAMVWTSMEGKTEVVGIRGQSVELKCIFSGKPNPDLVWNKKGAVLPPGRTDSNIGSAHQILKIIKLEFIDEGTYQCQAKQIPKVPVGSNTVPTADIKLKIEAKPYWPNPDTKMKDINATEGETIEIDCDVAGVPGPSIEFMINGVKLQDATANPRRVSMGNKKLQFKNLNRTTDLQVVQCVAKNKHGVLLGSSYINVLKRTTIIIAPVGDTLKVKEDYQFNCTAEGDPSTPLEISWFRDNIKLTQDSGKVIISTYGGTSTIRSSLMITEKVDEFTGTYKCYVSNGHSPDEKTADLKVVKEPVKLIVPPKADTTWIYIVIGVAAVLVIVLIVVIIVCKKRNQEIAYSVDSKERKAGHNPEKEIADSGFHDYNRPDEEPVGGSRASLTDSVKPLGDSDDDSMAEYGDIDTGKFNEDGSFIGLYMDDKSSKAHKNSYQNNVADSQV